MNEEFVDHRLHGYYKRKLATPEYEYAAKKLASQAHCGNGTIRKPGHMPAVFIVANNETAKIWGAQFCDSSWSCPICSAREMAKYASKIACAIDACDKINQAAFMITFTVPHYHDWTCKQVYDILRETWRRFAKQAKTQKNNGKNDVFAKFNNEFDCTYRIRVGEFTWGYYGWHPHYHCLFFVPKHKLQRVKDWQQKLSDRWFHLAKQSTIKILQRDNYRDLSATAIEKLVEDYYTSKKEKLQQTKEAMISLDEKGNVRRALSSDYVCGWGADRELTGNVRKEASHKGHFTPHQLLTKAWQLDNKGKSTNDERADKYFRRYVCYALATKGTYRMRMSPALAKLIAAWKQTNDYYEICKKKLAENQQRQGKNRLVVWFKPEQWYNICCLDLIPEILQLAIQTNGKQLIEQLLLKHHIDITRNGDYPLIKNLPDFIQHAQATDISELYDIA